MTAPLHHILSAGRKREGKREASTCEEGALLCVQMNVKKVTVIKMER